MEDTVDAVVDTFVELKETITGDSHDKVNQELLSTNDVIVKNEDAPLKEESLSKDDFYKEAPKSDENKESENITRENPTSPSSARQKISPPSKRNGVESPKSSPKRDSPLSMKKRKRSVTCDIGTSPSPNNNEDDSPNRKNSFFSPRRRSSSNAKRDSPPQIEENLSPKRKSSFSLLSPRRKDDEDKQEREFLDDWASNRGDSVGFYEERKAEYAEQRRMHIDKVKDNELTTSARLKAAGLVVLDTVHEITEASKKKFEDFTLQLSEFS